MAVKDDLEMPCHAHWFGGAGARRANDEFSLPFFHHDRQAPYVNKPTLRKRASLLARDGADARLYTCGYKLDLPARVSSFASPLWKFLTTRDKSTCCQFKDTPSIGQLETNKKEYRHR